MSEVTQKLQRMLAQAQGFSRDAPLEAVARAQLAVREAEQALASAHGSEREQLIALKAIAESRVERYGQELSGWTKGVEERANLFETHEQQRIEQPIPSK
ncbi:MAG: hypothetical protein QM778_35580 [Myxococcales bacterium]